MKVTYNITDRKPFVKALEEITGAKVCKFYEDGGDIFEPAEPSSDYTEDPAEPAET